MANKFPTKCNVCGENILMVRNSRGWKPLDFPQNSINGTWSGHRCCGFKPWMIKHLGSGLGGYF